MLYSSTFSATIMSVLYGISVGESDDPYISRAEVALEGFAAAGVPGSFMVDFFPVLKYLPSWFPGAGFQRKAKMWRELNDAVAEIPFKRIEDELVLSINLEAINTLIQLLFLESGRSSPFSFFESHRAIAT